MWEQDAEEEEVRGAVGGGRGGGRKGGGRSRRRRGRRKRFVAVITRKTLKEELMGIREPCMNTEITGQKAKDIQDGLLWPLQKVSSAKDEPPGVMTPEIFR